MTKRSPAKPESAFDDPPELIDLQTRIATAVKQRNRDEYSLGLLWLSLVRLMTNLLHTNKNKYVSPATWWNTRIPGGVLAREARRLGSVAKHFDAIPFQTYGAARLELAVMLCRVLKIPVPADPGDISVPISVDGRVVSIRTRPSPPASNRARSSSKAGRANRCGWPALCPRVRRSTSMREGGEISWLIDGKSLLGGKGKDQTPLTGPQHRSLGFSGGPGEVHFANLVIAPRP
jgi:hypothetical protein